MKPSAEGEERIAAMEGAAGEQVQYDLILARSLELIDQAFDYFSFVPAKGTVVKGSNKQPYIQLRD